VKDFLGKLEGIKKAIETQIADVKKGAESLVKDAVSPFTGIVDKLKGDLANVEKATAELGALIKSKPANAVDTVRRAMLAAWKGDESLVKALDAGYLTEDKVRTILPTLLIDGFNLLEAALVKTVDAQSTDFGLPALTGLGRGAENASDFAAISRNVVMPLAYQFLNYSQQEFGVSNLNIATENSQAYVTNRQATLAAEFVTGDGNGKCFGYQSYSKTITDEAGKLRIVKSTDKTAATIRLAIIAARNRLPAGTRHIVIFNGKTKSLLESQLKASGDTYFTWVNGKLMYEDCEVWQNNNVADVATSAIFAVVMMAQRGYGVGINPRMVLSATPSGSKIALYMGQGIGGAVLDFACIYGVSTDDVT
jgi:hypothetical protein